MRQIPDHLAARVRARVAHAATRTHVSSNERKKRSVIAKEVTQWRKDHLMTPASSMTAAAVLARERQENELLRGELDDAREKTQEARKA